jgi:hypothetical protein
LVGTIGVLLQTDRLRIAPALPETRVLVDELRNFEVRTAQNGRQTFGAAADWRVGRNDDLVLSVALAAWYGERGTPTVVQFL